MSLDGSKVELITTRSNGFRSGQNRDPTGDRPTFVDSSVRSVWIWRYPIDSPVTASVGPKKQSVDFGSRSWSDRSGRSNLSQISEKSQSGTRASQDHWDFIMWMSHMGL